MASDVQRDVDVLAVTTRSRLKSARFFASMVHANARIKRQLAATEGSLRFASVVMSPMEFWTISLWRSRDSMQEFVRAGAHQDLMWNFSHWFRSFWLMRWSPGSEEEGTWGNMRLARGRSIPPPAQTNDLRRSPLAAIPHLFEAIGSDGAPCYENAPEVRRKRLRVAGCVGATLRIESSAAGGTAIVLRHLRAMRARLRESDALSYAIGVAGPREAYALLVFRSMDAWNRFNESADLDRIRDWWGDSLWCMRWDAEHEFGHWDGVRFRHSRLGAP